MLKKFIAHSLVFSLVFNNLAFATQSIIELDFKDAAPSHRLQVMPCLSSISDVDHVKIYTDEQQVTVYRQEKQMDQGNDLQEALEGSESLPTVTHPVLIPKHDVHNLPWELEPEKLTLFILNHTAWLSPLGEDGYKLEFKGRLLGGMKPWGGGKKELVVDVTKFTVDCKGRNDYPSGTIGERFCNKNGNGSGNSGITVLNVSGTGGGGGSKGTSFGGSGWQSILGKGWAEIEANGDKARERMQKQQENLKKLSTVGQPVEIYKRPEIIIPQNPFPRVRPPQPVQPLPKDWGGKVAMIDQGFFRLSWCEMYELSRGLGVPDQVITDWRNYRASNKVTLAIYLEIKKKIEIEKAQKEETEKKKLQAIKEEQLKKLNQEKHKEEVKSLSQKFMRQERWFSDIQKPFQQNGKESVYKGFNYNINVPLSPLELEACQGKTVCVLSSLKTDTPGICRVQVVAFKGKVVTGCMQSDALPKDRSGYLFTALHFDFKDYDSVWVRPLMVGGKQEATISAWTYSTWITDIPIYKQEASQIKVAVNSKNTAGFVFPHSPLVYPYFSKDHTTAESFLPAKSYSLDTGNRLFQQFLTNMAGDEGSSSFQNALAVTPYIKNHVLQHTPFKDKDFPDLKTRSQSLLAMTAEALYGDSAQDFLDKSKIFYTKEIPFQELSKAYQTHHEILGHMLPPSWQEMIKKQGKTALAPHSDSLAKWSILHDVATEMGRRCGIPVPSVFSTLDVIQSITNAGFEFLALEPEERKVFCQQFDGFGKSLCGWLDDNFDPLFDGVLLLTTKGQGKPVPVKWPQLKPKIQANFYKNVPPILERVPDFKWTVKEANVADAIKGHSKFGKIYRDPTQKVGNKEIWWSKDIGGKNAHSGEHYKLFEQTKNGMQWIADVDLTGKVILKHKGKTGYFIPNSELWGIK